MSTVTARKGFLRKTELHPGLEFMFKPMDYESREKVNKAIRDAHDNPEKKTLLTCSTIKQQLASWDADNRHLFHFDADTDKKGEVLPLTVASIRQLRPVLIDGLFLIVIGAIASDPIPGATEQEEEDFAATLIKSAAENVSPGSVAAEREAGN
jgi:hypothetical protein